LYITEQFPLIAYATPLLLYKMISVPHPINQTNTTTNEIVDNLFVKYQQYHQLSFSKCVPDPMWCDFVIYQ
jgi:hypothetical protein